MFPDEGAILQIAGFLHVHRWVCPIPGVIGSVIRIEQIAACLLQSFCNQDALLPVASEFCKVLAWQSSLVQTLHLANHAVTHGDRIVLSAGVFDSSDDVRCEAQTVG